MSPITIRKVALPQQPFMLHTTAPFKGTFNDGDVYHQLVIHNVKSETQRKAVAKFMAACEASSRDEPVPNPQRGLYPRAVVVRPDDFMVVDAQSTREWFMIDDTEFATKDAWHAMQGAPATPQPDRVLGTAAERVVAGERAACGGGFYRYGFELNGTADFSFTGVCCSFSGFTPPEGAYLYLVWRDECVARACAASDASDWQLQPCDLTVPDMVASHACPAPAKPQGRPNHLFEAVNGQIFRLPGGLHAVANMDIPRGTTVRFCRGIVQIASKVLQPLFKYDLSALKVMSHGDLILRPGANSSPPRAWLSSEASVLTTVISQSRVDTVLPKSLRTSNADGTYEIAPCMCDAPSLLVLHLVV